MPSVTNAPMGWLKLVGSTENPCRTTRTVIARIFLGRSGFRGTSPRMTSGHRGCSFFTPRSGALIAVQSVDGPPHLLPRRGVPGSPSCTSAIRRETSSRSTALGSIAWSMSLRVNSDTSGTSTCRSTRTRADACSSPGSPAPSRSERRAARPHRVTLGSRFAAESGVAAAARDGCVLGRNQSIAGECFQGSGR